MTEFQELTQDAPNFVSMERGELVAYAYGMFAAGTKANTENAKLRNEVDNLLDFEHLTSVAVAYAGCDECGEYKQTMLRLFAENAKLRELARGLHMAYVETLNECESLNEGLIWEYSGSIDDDIAKSKARFEVNRHRFDAALCELGIEVSK